MNKFIERVGIAGLATLTLALALETKPAHAEGEDSAQRGRASEGSLVKAGEVPQGLDAGSWKLIQAQIEQSRYRLEPSARGIGGANPEQGWSLEFDEQGLSLNPATRGVRTAHEMPSSERDRFPSACSGGPLPQASPSVGAGHARDGLRPGASTEAVRDAHATDIWTSFVTEYQGVVS